MPDDLDLFSIIPGRSPSNAIVTGPMSEVMEYIGGSVARNEKEAQIAKAQRDAVETERHQQEVRTSVAQMLADGLTRLHSRLDEFEARAQTRADRLEREKEEAENARTEAFLASLPDPEDPATTAPLATTLSVPTGDDGDFEASNPPVDREKYDPDGVARAETITGVTPPELEKATPPEPGDFGPTAPAPSPYRNPASIGLN
jgi:hypothetical protein